MSFTVLIPARLASTRLPRKPLADIAGLPMIVHVARRCALSGAQAVVVAADAAETVSACQAHGVRAVLTRTDHATGSDRLAEACELLGLQGQDIVVNVQGDEPLIDPALVDACAALLARSAGCAAGRALYFSRAPIPWWRDGQGAGAQALPDPAPLRHVGLYAYHAGFLRRFPTLAQSPLERIESLEQLRVLWHGERIAVHVTSQAPGHGVDTPEDLERVRRLLAPAP